MLTAPPIKKGYKTVTSPIRFKSGIIQRVVRSQRTFKGFLVGSIRDRGYLLMVAKQDDGCWTPIHVIRKVK